ncbi:hypothetical protein GCM10027176_70560 [Actinoallomurus bryophytorum]|uniref:Alpha amylase inhibitor n=1 Tax=Actinoallomurus bryophytorum TaxID=1490222 RepID=A0A543CUG1_9ACTN|nr:hypothetical protein [Actinoallomurus bryophytorum]TQM00743.1 hypothetical protein FB559_6464 [Actinoallomurus bryophytorum]
MAKWLARGLKVTCATAFIATAAALPAQAATSPGETSAVRPEVTFSETFGPYTTWRECDNQEVKYIGARGVQSVGSCVPHSDGFTFTVVFSII